MVEPARVDNPGTVSAADHESLLAEVAPLLSTDCAHRWPILWIEESTT